MSRTTEDRDTMGAYLSGLTDRISSMDCISCAADTRVLDTRPVPGAVRRRRECLICRERFTTWERADLEADEIERTVVAYIRDLNRTEEGVAA